MGNKEELELIKMLDITKKDEIEELSYIINSVDGRLSNQRKRLQKEMPQEELAKRLLKA